MTIKEIKIDQNLCIGCGSCAALAAKAFEINDGKSSIKTDWQKENEANIKDAVRSCPVEAITIIEE